MEHLSVEDIKNIIEALKLGYLEHKRDGYMKTLAKIGKIAENEREKIKIKIEKEN